MIKPTRVEAIERRSAAVHEAGHLVAAESFGCYSCSAWIVRTGTMDPWERLWVGRVQFLAIKSLKPLQRRMVACAGSAAELCWRGEAPDPDYWTDPEQMSETDWQLSGCEPGKVDRWMAEGIERLAYLFNRVGGPWWPDVLTRSRQLILESREPAPRPSSG